MKNDHDKESPAKKPLVWLNAGTFMVSRIKELNNPTSTFRRRLAAQEAEARMHIELAQTEGADNQFADVWQAHLRSIESLYATAKSCDLHDLSFYSLRLLIVDAPEDRTPMIYLRNGRGQELVEMIQRMLIIHIKNVRERGGADAPVVYPPKPRTRAVKAAAA